MRVRYRVLAILSILGLLVAGPGCGPKKEVQTSPRVEVPREPTIEELRKPVSKDPDMYKAMHVIKQYGQFGKKYISYEKYREITGKNPGGAVDPDWFYDTYVLPMNEKGYWATVNFGSSKRAAAKDARIQELMAGLPENAITVKLQTPSGKTYLLIDAEADGVLDFAGDASQANSTRVDIQLLDQMQEKYTWIIGIIKKNYKK